MSLHLRIIRRNTIIIRLPSRNHETESRYSWLAFGRQPRNWGAEFSKALDLLMEEPVVAHDGVTFAEKSGRIAWRGSGLCTIIRLELAIYSIKKRQLIAAGLLKAARNATHWSQETTNG